MVEITMAGRRNSVSWMVIVTLITCLVMGPAVDSGRGVAEGAACSPFLLLNCIGTHGASDKKCCNAVREVLQPSCFCSEYRKGVVDASSVIPMAKRCNVKLHIGAKC
ncbi:hypothetical protein KP509_21G025500 [Ceratopteris richardii]|uniref:Uncharacterized protein n=1 Tax=Ceratopteris richardii TaxID=49495 RepID=A0A8T2SB21_CERRI|nr:hypothetical protein KP509_21G025500 [Ceratopteris richardii]